MDFNVGDIVEGKITGIKSFGAFMDLGEGKSGMVFIAEIANTFVNDIKDFYNVGDVVKAVITDITPEGKIALSIKRVKQDKPVEEKKQERKPYVPPKPDGSYVWAPKSQEGSTLDEMITKFKASSEDKFCDLKRRNPEARRNKRVGAK